MDEFSWVRGNLFESPCLAQLAANGPNLESTMNVFDLFGLAMLVIAVAEKA